MFIALPFPVPAYSAVFNISSGDVTGLIAAINAANSNGQENTINLEPGRYTLTTINNNTSGPNGLPSITSRLTIQGTEAETTIVERDGSVAAFRILHVSAVGDLTLYGLGVRRGFASRQTSEGRGGGIFNAGKLTLSATTIRDNAADDGGGGTLE